MCMVMQPARAKAEKMMALGDMCGRENLVYALFETV